MTNSIWRWVAAGLVALVLQSGCATTSNKPGTEAAAPLVRQLARTTHSWNGTLLPAYPQGQPEITILHITIPPGARLETHRHTVINAGVLLSGELTVVTSDGKTLRMKAGDPNVEVAGTLHYGINPGKAPAEILVVYAGAEGLPVTVTQPK